MTIADDEIIEKLLEKHKNKEKELMEQKNNEVAKETPTKYSIASKITS